MRETTARQTVVFLFPFGLLPRFSFYKVLFYFLLFCLIRLKFGFVRHIFVGYCSVSDVRLISGVSADIMGDGDVEALILLSGQQIRDELGVFTEPAPTRIKHFSALLTAIKIYQRPDMRFRLGASSGLDEQRIERMLEGWRREIDRIIAYYGKAVPESPSVMRRI